MATAEASTLRPLLLTESYPPGRGGMAQSCDRIVRVLRERGLSVDVAHLCRRTHTMRIEQQQGGRLLTCPLGEDSAHAINLLWNALSQQAGPAATHVLAFGGTLPLLAAPVFAAWLGVPLLVLLRGNDFDSGIVSPRSGWVLREALSRAAQVCVLSRDQQRKVRALYPHTPVHWIANSIDPQQWQLEDFDRQHAQAWRARTVAAPRRVIGLFGHLKQKKGGLLLLDALQRSGLAAGFHLLVIGDVEPALQAQLDALADVTGVTCLPFLDRLELLPWYAACDLVALPSHYDGMPNVALEAGALGIPLLASSAGGMADMLSDSDNALTFAPGDLHGCRRALEQAVRLSGDQLADLGQRLQARVLADFAPENEATGYLDVLRRTTALNRSGIECDEAL